MERSNPSMRPHRRSFRFSTLALGLALCLAATAIAGAQTTITKTYRVTGYTTGSSWSWQLNFTNPVGTTNAVGPIGAGGSLAAGAGQDAIVDAFVTSINGALSSAGVSTVVAASVGASPLRREFTITSNTPGADERDFYLLAGLSGPTAKVSTTGAYLGSSSNPGFLVRRVIDPATVLKAPSVLREGVNAPLPVGGQRNGVAFLTQTGTQLQLNTNVTGPLEYWGLGGSNVTLTHGGNAGMPAILLLGTPDTGWAQVPNLGSVDLDATQPLIEVYNGLLNPLVVTPVTLNYSLPLGFTGTLATVQGLVIDGSATLGFYLTARNDLGIQDPTTSVNGTPEMPPFVLNAPVPISPAVTSTYAYPRDGIVPNNGPASTSQDAFDGTLHSAIGINFDATQPQNPTANIAQMNGINVDLWHVRPNEIIFSLNPSHVPTIGGPLVIMTTGGTFTPAPDATESWVWATPVDFGLEGPGVGAPSVSGSFAVNTPGQTQGYIGWKDVAGQVDYYDIFNLLATSLLVYAGEYDDTNFTSQFVSQCSGLPSIPAATCYTEATEPFSQQWFAPNSLQDTWLHQGLGSAPNAPFIGTYIMDQDDGGPGVASFAGMSGIPGSATNPGLDPDGPWTPTGTDFIVVDDFPNTSFGAFPFKYVLLTYYP